MIQEITEPIPTNPHSSHYNCISSTPPTCHKYTTHTDLDSDDQSSNTSDEYDPYDYYKNMISMIDQIQNIQH